LIVDNLIKPAITEPSKAGKWCRRRSNPATASNLLFTDLQASTAQALALPELPLLGAQGFGAAVGNVLAPHNIVAAVAMVSLTGQEGRVLRNTVPTALIVIALGGVLALLLVV